DRPQLMMRRSSTARTSFSSNGSMSLCSRDIRLIQTSDLIDIHPPSPKLVAQSSAALMHGQRAFPLKNFSLKIAACLFALQKTFASCSKRKSSSPDKEFLVLESDGRAFTYRQFDDLVNSAASTLLSLGVTKGDCVSMLLTNRAEYLVFYFACFKIGAWAGPV